MVIAHVQKVSGDLTAFAWHRLRMYLNPEFTTQRLVQRHGLDRKQTKNAERQADEIRFSLLQAQEYFGSARHASLATRPLLLYYAAMSMALAEVLVKGTGDDRLSRLREKHNAHGLSLVVDGNIGRQAGIAAQMTHLRSVPQYHGAGDAYGTFEVWRRFVREHPVGVVTQQVTGAGQSTGIACMFVGADVAPEPTPRRGFSLANALASLPQLRQVFAHLGVSTACARVRMLHARQGASEDGSFAFTVQPGPQQMLDDLYSRIVLAPELINDAQFGEFESGLGMTLRTRHGQVQGFMQLPPSIMLSADETYFVTNGWAFGEFGSLYGALHIAGNLVRYYPDLWMPHVERSTSLALVIQELCEAAVSRLPILLAGEFDQIYYVAEA